MNRPGSRGTGIGAGGGAGGGKPPGTSMNRPGSGLGGGLRPGSGRLRTGAPAGPGTQAAQGISIQTNVNVSDRPVTGQGMMGMKSVGQVGRLVEDAAYHIGLIKKRIQDVNTETQRMRTEMDQNSKESSQNAILEKRYEKLIKNKEQLEGELADYNLALDKTRTSTDVDDVYHLAQHLQEKNKNLSQDIDQIFMMTKKWDNDKLDIENQIDALREATEKKMKSLDSSKRKNYEDLMAKQKTYEEKCLHLEEKSKQLEQQIRQLDVNSKGNSLKKEYVELDKKLDQLRSDCSNLQEELTIANEDPKVAHTQFVGRVNQFKQTTKDYEDKIAQIRKDIESDKKNLENLNKQSEEDSSDATKYDLLVKRDQEMSQFIDGFEDTRQGVLDDQKKTKEMIVALLEHISKGMEDASNLPSESDFGDMQDQKSFKEKNLSSAKKTMEGLQAEHKKRLKDLETLQNSEPRLRSEIENVKNNIARMKQEMKDFQDLEGLRRAFDATQTLLIDHKQKYVKRRDAMRQQVQIKSQEHENIKKQLNSNETHKNLEETEKTLKINEKTLFDLNESIESNKGMTDYESTKIVCLKITDSLNTVAVKKCSGVTAQSSNAQAKW